jgi:hypothetical protein
VQVHGEDQTDEVTVALHLEVPPGGNGRSRNEWVAAFNSLMCRKLPIYPPTEPSPPLAQEGQSNAGPEE